MYDSKEYTLKHIDHVVNYLGRLYSQLVMRGERHDKTKLCNPEKSVFDEFTPKLAESTYGSDEYKQYLSEMKPALDHHYAENRHHWEL